MLKKLIVQLNCLQIPASGQCLRSAFRLAWAAQTGCNTDNSQSCSDFTTRKCSWGRARFAKACAKLSRWCRRSWRRWSSRNLGSFPPWSRRTAASKAWEFWRPTSSRSVCTWTKWECSTSLTMALFLVALFWNSATVASVPCRYGNRHTNLIYFQSNLLKLALRR